MSVILPEPAPGFHWTSVSWGHVLTCDALDELVDHFFTGRELNLRGDSAEAIADWTRVAAEIGVAPDNLRRMRQVHGCAISIATAGTELIGTESVSSESVGPESVSAVSLGAQSVAAAPMPPEADGLLTIDPQVALAVQVADCVPLLLADPRTGAVAATHAGWRGAAANIAAATVAQLVQRWNVNPRDIVAAIGPSIGLCCYQVGPEVKAAFLQRAREAEGERGVESWFTPDASDPASDRLKLDMWKVNRDQLIAAGLLPEHVHVAALCTASHVDHLYSYRVEGPSTGRLLGVIRSRGPNAATR